MGGCPDGQDGHQDDSERNRGGARAVLLEGGEESSHVAFSQQAVQKSRLALTRGEGT